jgi:glycosyltransferase involved in cell wall biosynthesis
MHPRWKRLQWLQHYLGRLAATNIVTNDHLAELVRSHGGHATIVRDVPVVYSGSERYDMGDGFTVVVVCSFNPDEPIAEIFEAARRLPEFKFFMTGNPKHLGPSLAALRPENVQLTGFVSDEAYGSLLTQANVVMSLTTRDHTMLRGAWEAIYQSTPVIVSDWPCLRQAFGQGALFADNTAPSIAEAIKRCRESHDQLKRDAELARAQRVENWKATREELLRAIGHSNG